MIGSLGFAEILFILAIALLIFGPKRLPEVGRTLGKGLREFRKASNELRRSVEEEIQPLDPPVPAAVPKPAPAGSLPREPVGGASDPEHGSAVVGAAGGEPAEAGAADDAKLDVEGATEGAGDTNGVAREPSRA